MGSLAQLTLRARTALERDVKAAGPGKPFGIAPATGHFFGLAFLLAQVRLVELTESMPPGQKELRDWYRAAVDLCDWIRSEILDAVRTLERKAHRDGRPREAGSFRRAHGAFLRRLGTIYVLRSRETATLWTFLRRARVGRQRILVRRIVDPQGVFEDITSLPGRPNPDDQDNVEAISVDAALDRLAALQGQDVRVFGLRRTGSSRVTLHSTESRRKLRVRIPRKPLAGFHAVSARYVVVAGKLELERGKPVLRAEDIEEFRVPYVSLAGMGLLFPRTTPPLRLQPPWRTPTSALEQAAREELGLDGLGEILAGQQALVTDLLRHPEVRDDARLAALRAKSRKKVELDLRDREIRVLVWQILLQKFLANTPDLALPRLVLLLQRYLTFFTRHTFWNIRDTGKSYLDTTWPQDIAGQALHDCGVYAIETAYDLFRTVSAVRGAPAMSFEFLITADHATLIAFTASQSILVNNRRIDLPVDLPKAGGGVSSKGKARLQAVGQGYRRVHRLRFNVLPFVLTLQPVSTRLADTAFRRALWAAYLAVTGWGVDPGKGSAHYQEPARIRSLVENPPGRSRQAPRAVSTPARRRSSRPPPERSSCSSLPRSWWTPDVSSAVRRSPRGTRESLSPRIPGCPCTSSPGGSRRRSGGASP